MEILIGLERALLTVVEKVLTGLRDSCHSQAILKSMPLKVTSD